MFFLRNSCFLTKNLYFKNYPFASLFWGKIVILVQHRPLCKRDRRCLLFLGSKSIYSFQCWQNTVSRLSKKKKKACISFKRKTWVSFNNTSIIHCSESEENAKNGVRKWKVSFLVKIMPKVTWIFSCISCFPTQVLFTGKKRDAFCIKYFYLLEYQIFKN